VDDVSACRVCGGELRPGDDVTVAGEGAERYGIHAGCAEAPVSAKRRRLGSWMAFGSRHQMEMGPAQRGDLED
jgi:hypothetical protein